MGLSAYFLGQKKLSSGHCLIGKTCAQVRHQLTEILETTQKAFKNRQLQKFINKQLCRYPLLTPGFLWG